MEKLKIIIHNIRKNLKVTLLASLLILFLLYKFFDKENSVDGYGDVNLPQQSDHNNFENENYIVEIKGEVNRPGLYVVSKNARISDIIDLALGFTEYADDSNINLAEKIVDGMLIIVNKSEKKETLDKISINYASLEQLQKIPHIGKSKANNIIEYREKNDGFTNIEEIINVNGISKNLFEQIKEYICL